MKAFLRTSGRITTRLLVIAAVLAAAVAAVSAPSAAAATSSYWATFPPGECAGNTITTWPPYSVSAWAGDTQIAWRAHHYKLVNGVAYEQTPTPWQWAKVVGGQVYAPYGQAGYFHPSTPGVYAVQVEVYSYGLRQYYNYRLALRYSDWLGQQWQDGTCQFS